MPERPGYNPDAHDHAAELEPTAQIHEHLAQADDLLRALPADDDLDGRRAELRALIEKAAALLMDVDTARTFREAQHPEA